MEEGEDRERGTSGQMREPKKEAERKKEKEGEATKRDGHTHKAVVL